MIDRYFFQYVFLTRNKFFSYSAHFERYEVLHEILEVREIVILTIAEVWTVENDGFEGILLPINLQDLLNEEVELLLLLKQEARPHALDPFISHTDLGNQEVEKHDLHDEDVGNEEKPGDADDGILVAIRQMTVLILRSLLDPRAILRLRQVTNRVPKSLQNRDDQREWIHVLISIGRVASFQDMRNNRKQGTESEEHNQERIDVFGHLDQHFHEEAEGLIIPNKLQEPSCTLHEANDGHDFEVEPLGRMALQMKLMPRHEHLDQVKRALSRVHVVPTVLHVAGPARVMYLRILERQEEELRRSAYDLQQNLQNYQVIRHGLHLRPV